MAGEPPPPFGLPSDSTAWPVMLAVAVALLSGGNTLLNGFAYDDLPIIVQNPAVALPDRVADVWTKDYWAHARGYDAGRDLLFRPLTVLSFRLNYLAGGTNPVGYHLINVLLHAAVAALLVIFAARIGCPQQAHPIAGAFFAAMPIHTEAVANVVGRAELLATLFTLVALIIVLRLAEHARIGVTNAGPEHERVGRGPVACAPGSARQRTVAHGHSGRVRSAQGLLWRVVLGACVLAALLSKESGIAAVILAPLFALVAGAKTKRIRRFCHVSAVALVAVAAYSALRYHALDGRLIQSTVPSKITNLMVDATAAERFWGAWQLLGMYVAKTVWPQNLCMDYSYRAVRLAASPANLYVGIGVLTVAVLFGVAVFWWRKGRTTLALTCAALAISYLPVSNTAFLIKTLFAERVWYLPSAFLAVVLGTAIAGLLGTQKRQRVGHWVLLLVVLAGLARCWDRNTDWRDNTRLFMSAYWVHPTSAPVLCCYGRFLADVGDRRGITLLERCVRMAPGLFDAQLALGRARLEAGDPAGAIAPLQAAAMQHGEHPEVHSLLAEASLQVSAARQSQLDRLRERYEQNGDLKTLCAWTDALVRAGRVNEALSLFARESERFGDDPDYHRAHAVVLMLAGQRNRAIEVYRASVALADGQADVLVELATALIDRHRLGDVPEAEELIEQAFGLSPNDPQVLIARATLLEDRGRWKEARDIYRGLLDRVPPGELRSMLRTRLEILEHD